MLKYRLASPWRLIRTPFVYARLGRSVIDGFRATVLRLSSNRVGRLLVPGKLWKLNLRALKRPVYLRPGTVDFLVVRQIYEGGEYEAVKTWSLPPRPVVFDLGGNVGLASLYFDAAYNEPTFVAVEPDESNVEVLKKNCQDLIGAGRMQVFRAFAAAEDGAAALSRTGENWGFQKVDLAEGAAGEAIPCVSVPSLMERTGTGTIDLLKCDIEGSEVEIFKACRPWIGRVRHLVVETHPPYSNEELCRDLKDAGWQFEVTRVPGQGDSLCFARQVSPPS